MDDCRHGRFGPDCGLCDFERSERNKLTFVVPGTPVAKGRPRLGKNGSVYTPRRTKSYEREVAMMFKAKYPGRKLIKKHVAITLEIFVVAPKTLRGRVGYAWESNIDIDNVCKSILDGLNGVAYEDDRQVVALHARKLWSREPSVIVTIDPMD